MEQKATLKSWERGACKGLLSDPDLPALSLSQASIVVLLSPMLTDTQFTQAAGWVARQGSLLPACADKIERFRRIASAPSAGSAAE